MLTVYSTYGSPGASTTAVYLAAQCASSGHQVLLIEADPAAGSLSQKLGIQFTPGTASFVAANRPVTSASLIEHSQDVLLSDFHVMPSPLSPAGAKSVAEKFVGIGSELRDISDNEMAVIVDGGRLNAAAATSELTTCAAAVLVVAGDRAELPSLEHLSGVLVDDPSVPGPLGLAANVGPPTLADHEWMSKYRLAFVGSVELSPERGTDLSMFMSRGKRKSRKLRASLEKLADSLYPYACQAAAAAPQPRLTVDRSPAEDTVDDGTPAADDEDAAPVGLAAAVQQPISPAAAPSAAAADPMMPAASTPPHEPLGHLASGHDARGRAPVPHEQPPAAHGYPQPGHPQAPPPGLDYPPPDHPPPHYPQPPYPQPGPAPQEFPDGHYDPPGHAGHAPPPAHQYPYPPPGDIGAAPAPDYPHYGDSQPHYPPQGYQPPAYDRIGEGAPLGYDDAVPEPPVEPTGSFRTWAANLFGESAGEAPDEGRPRPGEGATA